jgi:hypothetical protein
VATVVSTFFYVSAPRHGPRPPGIPIKMPGPIAIKHQHVTRLRADAHRSCVRGRRVDGPRGHHPRNELNTTRGSGSRVRAAESMEETRPENRPGARTATTSTASRAGARGASPHGTVPEPPRRHSGEQTQQTTGWRLPSGVRPGGSGLPPKRKGTPKLAKSADRSTSEVHPISRDTRREARAYEADGGASTSPWACVADQDQGTLIARLGPERPGWVARTRERYPAATPAAGTRASCRDPAAASRPGRLLAIAAPPTGRTRRIPAAEGNGPARPGTFHSWTGRAWRGGRGLRYSQETRLTQLRVVPTMAPRWSEQRCAR